MINTCIKTQSAVFLFSSEEAVSCNAIVGYNLPEVPGEPTSVEKAEETVYDPSKATPSCSQNAEFSHKAFPVCTNHFAAALLSPRDASSYTPGVGATNRRRQ